MKYEAKILLTQYGHPNKCSSTSTPGPLPCWRHLWWPQPHSLANHAANLGIWGYAAECGNFAGLLASMQRKTSTCCLQFCVADSPVVLIQGWNNVNCVKMMYNDMSQSKSHSQCMTSANANIFRLAAGVAPCEVVVCDQAVQMPPHYWKLENKQRMLSVDAIFHLAQVWPMLAPRRVLCPMLSRWKRCLSGNLKR